MEDNNGRRRRKLQRGVLELSGQLPECQVQVGVKGELKETLKSSLLLFLKVRCAWDLLVAKMALASELISS